jgi:AbrB family looped-hinge helix DNA binding protein
MKRTRKPDISSESIGRLADMAPMQRVNAGSALVTVWTAKIDSRGRITLPKAIRQHLGVGPGDKLEFELVPDGRGALMWAKPSKVVDGFSRPLTDKTKEGVMRKKLNNAVPKRQAGTKGRTHTRLQNQS